MEPVIRNYRSLFKPGGASAGGFESVRLITLEDNPPTCVVNYQVIEPGKTSPHHLHPWEHEVYILEGSGVLVCDGKEYPVKEGDGIFIPGNVDHYTLNNRRSGVIRRLEVNPIIAQAADARNQMVEGGKGTGQPPIIRNYRDLDMKVGHVLLSSEDGAPNYVMLYNVPLAPGAATNPATGGHTHQWEHVVYILQGSATLACAGKSYTNSEGDVVLVPPKVHHEWKNETRSPMLRVTFNPVASVAHAR